MFQHTASLSSELDRGQQLVYQLAHLPVPVSRHSTSRVPSQWHSPTMSLSQWSHRLTWPVHACDCTATDRPSFSAGATAVWVAMDGQVAGLAVINDRHRSGAAAVLAELRGMK